MYARLIPESMKRKNDLRIDPDRMLAAFNELALIGAPLHGHVMILDFLTFRSPPARATTRNRLPVCVPSA